MAAFLLVATGIIFGRFPRFNYCIASLKD